MSSASALSPQRVAYPTLAPREVHEDMPVAGPRCGLPDGPSDLPVGLFCNRAVNPQIKKYSAFQNSQITLYSRHPVPPKGALARSSTNAGRVAVDAAALARNVIAGRVLSIRERLAARRRRCRCVRQNRVVPTPRCRCQVSRRCFKPNRADASIFAGRRRLASRTPGRARYKP
jgi:hypothetical protein